MPANADEMGPVEPLPTAPVAVLEATAGEATSQLVLPGIVGLGLFFAFLMATK